MTEGQQESVGEHVIRANYPAYHDPVTTSKSIEVYADWQAFTDSLDTESRRFESLEAAKSWVESLAREVGWFVGAVVKDDGQPLYVAFPVRKAQEDDNGILVIDQPPNLDRLVWVYLG
jgi:hypothetical protein